MGSTMILCYDYRCVANILLQLFFKMIYHIQIFTWIGINPEAFRNALINDFLSKGLEGLREMSSDGSKDTFSSYIKRTDPPFPVVLSLLKKQRLRGLVLLVKDMMRAD